MRVGRQRSNPLISEAGFSEFYESRSDALLLFFTRRVFDVEVALDLSAETFAQALLGRNRFRGRTDEQAVAWLYAIARRQLATYYERGHAERTALEKLGVSVPDLSADAIERIEDLASLEGARDALNRGLEQIPPAQRTALQLRVVEELPYREVARRLNISEQNARARVSRALQALAEMLEDRMTLEEMSS